MTAYTSRERKLQLTGDGPNNKLVREYRRKGVRPPGGAELPKVAAHRTLAHCYLILTAAMDRAKDALLRNVCNLPDDREPTAEELATCEYAQRIWEHHRYAMGAQIVTDAERLGVSPESLQDIANEIADAVAATNDIREIALSGLDVMGIMSLQVTPGIAEPEGTV